MALKEIHFLPEVSEDLREAYIWYEEKEPGLGLECFNISKKIH